MGLSWEDVPESVIHEVSPRGGGCQCPDHVGPTPTCVLGTQILGRLLPRSKRDHTPDGPGVQGQGRMSEGGQWMGPLWVDATTLVKHDSRRIVRQQTPIHVHLDFVPLDTVRVPHNFLKVGWRCTGCPQCFVHRHATRAGVSRALVGAIGISAEEEWKCRADGDQRGHKETLRNEGFLSWRKGDTLGNSGAEACSAL